MGQFNLDPNRVVDLLLECCACCLARRTTFVSLLRRFNLSRDVLADIILMKFVFFKVSRLRWRVHPLQRAKHTSNSFYRAVAILCVEGLVDADTLFARIEPTQTAIKDDYQESRKLLLQRCQKAKNISTIAAMELQNNHASTSSEVGSTQASFESACRAQLAEDHKLGGATFDEVGCCYINDFYV